MYNKRGRVFPLQTSVRHRDRNISPTTDLTNMIASTVIYALVATGLSHAQPFNSKWFNPILPGVSAAYPVQRHSRLIMHSSIQIPAAYFTSPMKRSTVHRAVSTSSQVYLFMLAKTLRIGDLSVHTFPNVFITGKAFPHF
jgi:hypothetical protein